MPPGGAPRQLPFMTSALRGGGGSEKVDTSTNKLHEWDSDKGGSQKSEKFKCLKYEAPYVQSVLSLFIHISFRREIWNKMNYC